MSLRFIALSFVSSIVGSIAVGCSPRIGDGCYTQTNCSINGDRVCDITQPGGYCTVFDCSPDTCPDNSVCVRFEPDTARLARNVCMRRCGGDGDCRTDRGYRCVGNRAGFIFGTDAGGRGDAASPTDDAASAPDSGTTPPDGGAATGTVVGHRFTVADVNNPDGTFCLAPQ